MKQMCPTCLSATVAADMHCNTQCWNSCSIHEKENEAHYLQHFCSRWDGICLEFKFNLKSFGTFGKFVSMTDASVKGFPYSLFLLLCALRAPKVPFSCQLLTTLAKHQSTIRLKKRNRNKCDGLSNTFCCKPFAEKNWWSTLSELFICTPHSSLLFRQKLKEKKLWGVKY